MKKWSIVLFLFISTINAREIIFVGVPIKAIKTSESSSDTKLLTDSEKIKVVITKEGENYYWTSRGDIALYPTTSGNYITYIAFNGAGYIRIINLETQTMIALLPDELKIDNYSYVEHLTYRMGSFTYYGR